MKAHPPVVEGHDGRLTDEIWSRAVPAGPSGFSYSAKPKPCGKDACRWPASGSLVVWEPLMVTAGQYCDFHGFLMATYGVPDRPDYLQGAADCIWQQSVGDGPERCFEPQVANGLCIRHVTRGRTDYPDLLYAIDGAWHPPRPESGPVTEDTNRVLQAVAAIQTNGNPSIPMHFWEAFSFFVGTSSTMAHRSLRDIEKWGFWMSPFTLASILRIDEFSVATHLMTLESLGYIRVLPVFRLPVGFVSVIEEQPVSVKESLQWRWWGVKRRFPHLLRKEFPWRRRIPRIGQSFYTPTGRGPGIVKITVQGKFYALTDTGYIHLTSWSAGHRSDLAARRVGRAALAIALASLISVIADLPHAVESAGRLLRAVFGD